MRARRVDQRAGARHRHRRARRLRDGRLSRHDRRDLAARRPRRPPQRPLGGGAGGQQRAARSVRRPQPVVLLRRVARARADRPRQPAHPGRPREVRGVRAAVHGTETFGRDDVQEVLRHPARERPRAPLGRCRRRGRRRRSGTGPASRIRPTRSACARSRRTTSWSSTPRAAPTSSARPTSPAVRRRCTRRRSTSSKGALFQVEQLDFEDRKAYVRADRLRLLHRRDHLHEGDDARDVRRRDARQRRRTPRRGARRRRGSSASRRSSSTPTRTSARASSTCPSSRCTRRRTG